LRSNFLGNLWPGSSAFPLYFYLPLTPMNKVL
jgi:hypothetical protein